MKVAIAGYGVEGEQNVAYWQSHPDVSLTIIDEREQLDRPLPEDIPARLGEGAFDHLDEFDMVVRTAGLAPYKLQTTATIWSATNEFFARCPAKIIGVTGSKGKGTTASLIAAILEAAGYRTWLVGNIGIPALSVLSQVQPEDIVIYELSSFQLWDLQQSPHTAVALFIEQEHLDMHRTMDEYVAAKANITAHQTATDTLIYHASNEYVATIANGSIAQKIPFPSASAAHITDDAFYYGDERLCDVGVLSLVGVHNQQNALAAIDAVWEYTHDAAAIAKGLAAFKGLPHRLSYVATVNDVAYYDDSIATTPTSAIAALRAFADRQKVIILGGSHKGADFSELAHELTRHDVQAILIGDEAAEIAAACDAAGFTRYEIMYDATAMRFTERATALAQPGGVVLLSPASASFGLFKNYVDRGEQFIAAVRRLSSDHSPATNAERAD